MQPLVIDWTEPESVQRISEILLSEKPLFAFEFDRVFGLVAPMSTTGIDLLNKTKNRPNGKTYGSLLISSDAFIANSLISIPEPKKFFDSLNNCFIRVPFKCIHRESEITRSGAHQTMILENTLLKFFESLHTKCSFPTEPFFEHPYPSFLVTSANISGQPVITTWDEMASFALEKEISVMVKTGLSGQFKGSFPIIDFTTPPFSIARSGIRDKELLDISLSLFKK